MWEVHSPEVLPLLSRVMPKLETPELVQASDDVLAQITGPGAAAALAERAMGVGQDPIRRRQLLNVLALKLGGAGKGSRGDAKVVRAVGSALEDDSARLEGIKMAAATGDGRYGDVLAALVDDPMAGVEVRAAAVEAAARVKATKAREV